MKYHLEKIRKHRDIMQEALAAALEVLYSNSSFKFNIAA